MSGLFSNHLAAVYQTYHLVAAAHQVSVHHLHPAQDLAQAQLLRQIMPANVNERPTPMKEPMPSLTMNARKKRNGQYLTQLPLIKILKQ